MAAKTLLQITNDVLTRLRESTAADLSEDYPALVAGFVSDMAGEVNETGPGWTALNHTLNVALVADQRVYDLSATVANGGDVQNGDTVTTERSTLLFDPIGRPLSWLFDDSSDDDGRTMIYMDENDVERRFQMDRDSTQQEPLHFTVRMNSTYDGLELVFWETPSASRHVRMRFNTPEATLDVDTDASTTILVPNRPVFLGALYLALNERGEEIGEPGGIAERRYINALSAAIEREIRVRERAGYFDWVRD